MSKKEGRAKAISLRKQGNSYAQISAKLGISKSTAYLWARDVVLSKITKQILNERLVLGRRRGVEIQKRARDVGSGLLSSRITQELAPLAISPVFAKILCAFLYWCEGGKTDRQVRFMNSDPELIATFLRLFRTAFQVDETKFRVCLHLHEFHQEKQELDFWSGITSIPLSQFNRIYQKANSGKRKKVNYHGCASVRYHDVKVWQELREVYTQFSKKINGRVV